MKKISVVVPCYNEQDVLTTFYKETEKITATIDGYSFEYIFIDDGSKDDTLIILKGMASSYDNVKYISFTRNFGKEAGILAGLKNADGDYTIVMDADLQHPPVLFYKFIEGIENGYDCCAAYRTTRKGENKLRNVLSRFFYRINSRITELDMPHGAVDYRIMSRRMVDAICSLPEKQRFSKGIFSWVGFNTLWIPYENVERTMGSTKWNFRSLTKYAMDGIFSFTVKPLKILVIIGFIISFAAIVYAAFILIKTLALGIDAPGYASLMIMLLFLGGIIEISIGIVGEYIARMYNELKNRPVYITSESNIEKENNDEITDK